MRKQCVAIVAVLAFAATAGSAQAQSPLGGLLGTGAQCTGGLVSVTLGTTTVCVAPSVPGVPSTPGGVPTQSCPDGGVADGVLGQGRACVLPGQALPPVPGSCASCRRTSSPSPTRRSVVTG